MMFPRMAACAAALSLSLLASARVCAQVSLPAVLSDHMVLQRGIPVPIWGTASAGESITVTFAGQSLKTDAGKDGSWSVRLKPMEASAEGRSLSVEGKDKRTLKDILVGEVWICSGQSNMEWRVKQSANAAAEIQNARYPQLRLFDVPGHTTAPRPQAEGRGAWAVCTPASVAGFSAVGYFFGRRLMHELDVPIGLVGVNWGGTRIEPWIDQRGFESVPELGAQAAVVKANAEAGKPVKHTVPAAIYNSMVHPLVPFAARGAIWYQGESNGNEGDSYYRKTKALVQSWRGLFQPKLAFYWVQLANFRKPNPDPAGGDGWARLREAQRKAVTLPGTGMAVITDIGEAGDIHPRNKQDVGWRLAQWALHQDYGRNDLVPCGPMYRSHKVEGGSIRISFDHVGKGLMAGSKSGLVAVRRTKQPLGRFAIAGEDRKWVWAEAKIDGGDVVVSAASVPAPVAVRYAFSTNPSGANLYNQDGFPASPFRTDDWAQAKK